MKSTSISLNEKNTVVAVNKSDAELGAVTLSTSEFPAAAVMTTYGGSRDMLEPLMLELQAQAKAIQSGDTRLVEAMYANQAVALQHMFFVLAKDAKAAKGTTEKQAMLQLALRAQSNSRATLQALMEAKNPRQFSVIKQANVAHNQQVNNGVAPSSREKSTRPAQNEVFVAEADDGSTTLDA